MNPLLCCVPCIIKQVIYAARSVSGDAWLQQKVVSQCLKSLSEICIEEGDFSSAVKTYKLIGESLDTYFSPSALEAVGDIYHTLGETEQAISAYEDVILRFPDSVSAGEARRKIELVRRENSEDS